MSFPVEFSVGALRLSAHLIFEVLAFFIGYRYFVYLRKGQEDPISEDNRIKIIVGAAFGAFLFSRLLGSLENPAGWFHEENLWLYFFKNKTIVGGLLGGLLGVELIKKAIGEKNSSGDLFVFPLILAMMIGRIGCFSSGIYEATFGVETAMPFGLDLGDGLKRHPVSLYEIAFLGVLWLALRWFLKKKPFPSGWLFQFFMFGYLLFRLLLDWIKPVYVYPFGLSGIQLACLLGMLYYYKVPGRIISLFQGKI